MGDCLLEFQDVHREFPTPAGRPRPVLLGIDFALERGESLAMVGRSGSGKSTLLHLAAGIDLPSRGEVRLAGRSLASLDDPSRSQLRREHVGLVFQFFHLLPHLTVRDNVSLPGWIAGDPHAEVRARADALLAAVELGDRGDDLAGRLSGGQMQRVAICRALQRRPGLVLADEPTGNLDETVGTRVMDLLVGLCANEEVGLLYVTHSREQASRADRVLGLRDGHLNAAEAAG